jgi:hypothetical protein
MLRFLAMLMIGQLPPTEDAEHAFLGYRQELSTGRLTVSGVVQATKPISISQKWTKKIWFDGKKYRCDQIDEDRGNFRTVYCEHCERENAYVYFDESKVDPTSRAYPVTIQTIDYPKNAPRLGAGLKLDPRAIGTSTQSILHLHHVTLSQVIGRTDRSEPLWEKAKWKDHDALVVTYTLNHGPIMRMTYVPDMGNSLVMTELTHNNANGRIAKRVVESEPRKFGTKGSWFPWRVSGQFAENGAIVEQYSLEISDVAFMEGINPNVFALSGMNIPPATLIQMVTPDKNGTHRWDGKRIVPAKSDPGITHVDKSPEGILPRDQHWLSALSVSLALLGCSAFGVFYYRKWRAR